MEQVQNVEILQDGTECIALGESLAEYNDSVSPTYLKATTHLKAVLTDQETKKAPNINKKIKSSQEVSSGSTFSNIPPRKIITARRKLESKRVATLSKPAVVGASPSDKVIFVFEASSSLEESISNSINSRDDKGSSENSGKLCAMASTEDKTSNSTVYNSADDSDNESDEELERLIAISRWYKRTEKKTDLPITTKEFRQITGANIDVISYIVSKIDDIDERRSFEDPLNVLRTAIEELAELNEKERDDEKAQDICRAIKDESKAAELEVLKERLDSIEARLLSLDEDNNPTIPQIATSMTARPQHSLVIQSNQKTSSIKENKTKMIEKEKDQQLVETELLEDFQNFKIAPRAVTTSKQRCWCDAGQLKLQLKIERAIVKRWVSNTPIKEEIDLEAGHIPSKSCKLTVPRISKTTNDWWTEELADLRLVTVRARNAYTHSHRRQQQNVENQSELLQAYRSARNTYTHAIKLAKQRVLDQSSI